MASPRGDDASPPRQKRRSRWEDADDDHTGGGAAAGSAPAAAEPNGREKHADDEPRQTLNRRSRSRSPQRCRRFPRSRSRSRDRGREGDDHARRRGRDEDDGDDRRRRQPQQSNNDRGNEDRGNGGGGGGGTAAGRRQSRWAQVDAAADAADHRRGGGGGGGGGGEQQRAPGEQKPPPPPQQPQFGLSGALAAETNATASGVTLLHAPPADAAPAPGGGNGGGKGRSWRLYVFKGGHEVEGLPPLPLQGPTRSTFLFGRDRRVADVPTDHLSCSKQHAVIQFRRTQGMNESKGSVSRPYLMDLGSTNGTFLNGERIEAQRYHELLPKDVVRFGESTREFVVLTDESV